MTSAAPAPADVLDFWFGDGSGIDPRWFKGSDAFDREIAARFGAALQAALAGGLDRWADTTDGALALLLLLDQFTRNIHRGTPLAFAGDAQALALSRRLVATGEHLQLPPLRRWFAYMPLEHAEDLSLQAQCVQLFEALAAETGPHRQALAGALDYARRHHDVISRFGRFPHRNAILGRASSAEEAAFLRQPGSSF